ncbi:hypothetical protein [Bradyrhizobium mercantei]|uniref:hypothetical protein n=1 Tax=Bradyrhizobium mercantei TaxID=1904807 RepID=UPI0011788F53|nr:hypothetical protein [Bradyrhizobium mercantei]
MKQFLAAIFIASLSSSAWAVDGYMGFDKPCPDQNPHLRRPAAWETCDYVTIIKRCDGDLAERVFNSPRHPSKLISENGPNPPRRLVCHHD